VEFIFGALVALFFLGDAALPPRTVPQELVVLLPGGEQPVGKVVVDRAGQKQVLDRAYAASRISGDAKPVADRLTEDGVQREFGDVLAALPSLSQEMVVVVPAEDGHVGTVVVQRAGGEQVLHEAYAASRIRSVGAPEREQLTEPEVRSEFGDLLAALPSLTEETVAVIPAEDGHIGTVVVERAGVQRVLHQAYLSSRIRSLDAPDLEQLDQGEIQRTFGATLAAMPHAPAKYLLYFILGTDDLTPDSVLAVRKVLAEITARPSADVLLIGHTDTVGDDPHNDLLSLQRAERVKEIMVKVGVPADRIEVAGRGSRELLVPTGPNVDEPRNRRVEINVR